ncbi:MAG: SGNH/GDSL hydrolase family protein [Lachnospiraceae bacterium]|nr:SGNH/GDSL hydrolase family protein [Lachnospiraceae bacterium]
MKKLTKRILVLLTVLALTITGMTFTPNTKASAADASGRKIVVSLGDSYSSGEGIEPFFGQDKKSAEKVKDEDWLAHRSEKAWSGMLKVDGQKMVKDDNWFFVAASGAEVENLTGTFTKSYNYDGLKGSKDLAPQFDVFDEVNKKYGEGSIDFVTMSIGGNDVGFASIMVTAIQKPNELDALLEDTWDRFMNEQTVGGKKVPSIRESIKESYRAIAKKAGSQAAIIVAGYPKLLNPAGFTVVIYKVSGETATKVDEWAAKLNAEIKKAVEECKEEGLNIYYVSVEEAFEGHEAYSSDPYINSAILGSKDQDLDSTEMISGYSLHPNESGAKAYAKEVQKVVDEVTKASAGKTEPETKTKATKPVVTATVKSGTVTLKWDKVEGATKYKVIEYVNGKAKTVKSLKKSKTSYKISGREAGKYTFAVKAYVKGKWTKITKTDKVSVTVK